MMPSSGMEYSELLYLEVSVPKPHLTDTTFKSSFTGRSSCSNDEENKIHLNDNIEFWEQIKS